jgi:hypothetical protein
MSLPDALAAIGPGALTEDARDTWYLSGESLVGPSTQSN